MKSVILPPPDYRVQALWSLQFKLLDVVVFQEYGVS